MREIAHGQPALVIAEAGINHQGDVNRALEMVRAAAKAGADAFKIQCYTADEFCGPEETYTYRIKRPSVTTTAHGAVLLGPHLGEIVYASPWTSVTEKQRDMFKRCELDPVAVNRIRDACRNEKLGFIATATDATWIARLAAGGIDAFKVGSDDLVHGTLLAALSRTGVPVIVSTGMATLAEIKEALVCIRPAALLHCVSLYPTPPDKANLLRMVRLAQLGVPVGFSDHTEGVAAAAMAAGLGAAVIEKHFTLDKSLPGPDHWFSADPEELASLVRVVRHAKTIVGVGDIDPSADEQEMARLARRSIVAAHDIPDGMSIKREMLAYRRPGTGVLPTISNVAWTIGRRAKGVIEAGAQILAENTDTRDSDRRMN